MRVDSRRKFLGNQPNRTQNQKDDSGHFICTRFIRSSDPSLQTLWHSYIHETVTVDTSLLVHPKDKPRLQDVCECVYKIPRGNCDKTYTGETGSVWSQTTGTLPGSFTARRKGGPTRRAPANQRPQNKTSQPSQTTPSLLTMS